MADLPNHTRSRATGRVTLAEVARQAGVSPITVSRALRGDRNVAAELVERVRNAAATLAYVPDPAAQSLASSRNRSVVVFVPLLSNRVFGDLLEAAQRSLLLAGYQTLFGVTHYDRLEEEQLLRSYLALRPGGLIMSGSDHTENTRQMLRASGVPRVHLMEQLEAPDEYCVGFSQAAAGHAMTQHLVERGRRRIAFAAAQLDPRVMQRADGYRQCLREAGLYDPALEWLDPRSSSIALGAEMFDRIRAERPSVDAIFYCNDDLAQGGLLAALRGGVTVPKAVAIAGFNDLEGSDQMLPSLTTVRTPRTAVGQRGAELLVTLMRGDTPASRFVDLGYELVQREST